MKRLRHLETIATSAKDTLDSDCSLYCCDICYSKLINTSKVALVRIDPASRAQSRGVNGVVDLSVSRPRWRRGRECA